MIGAPSATCHKCQIKPLGRCQHLYLKYTCSKGKIVPILHTGVQGSLHVDTDVHCLSGCYSAVAS